MFEKDYVLIKPFDIDKGGNWFDFSTPFKKYIVAQKYPALNAIVTEALTAISYTTQRRYGIISAKAIFEFKDEIPPAAVDITKLSESIFQFYFLPMIEAGELEQKARIYQSLKELAPNSRGEETTEYTPRVMRQTKAITVNKAGYNTAQSGIENQSAGAQSETQSGDIKVEGVDTTLRKLAGGQTIGDLYAEMESIRSGIISFFVNIINTISISIEEVEEYPYNLLQIYNLKRR